jgi:hypothetical protein
MDTGCEELQGLSRGGVTPASLSPPDSHTLSLNEILQFLQSFRDDQNIDSKGFLRLCDRLYGLVVSFPAHRSRGPGSIPGATRFSKK